MKRIAQVDAQTPGSQRGRGTDRDGLDRRTFLAAAGLGFAAACGGARGGRGAGAVGGAAGAAAAASGPARWIEEATLAELAAGLARGAHTARELTEAYLARIDALDRRGPALRAVIEVNPDAVAIAEQLDRERRAGRVRGPLHGIPVLVKDNLDSADRMSTTAGSLALVGAKPARDATVVARLRAAGAVLLGKTNLSEWANIRSTRSVSGWSARGGQTRNPYALDRSPCGSSSGSGAAVAASLCAVAIGTETDGSILCPSSLCGLVGVKPTVGLVSRAGIIPISHSQDTAGPMARSVADAAVLLAAIAGADPRDPATAAARAADYAAALAGDVRGLRIGVVRQFFGAQPEQDQLAEAAIAALRARGAVVVDGVALPAIAGAAGGADPELEVLLHELKAGLNAYLAGLGPSAPVRSLADVIAFDEAHAAEEMPLFGQELFVRAEAKGPLTDAAYLAARERCLLLARTQGIDAAIGRDRLDALVAPTASPAWIVDPVLGDHFVGSSTQPAAVAGYPSVTVPIGFVRGLPVGLSIFGAAYTEPVLLRLAGAVERELRARRPPAFAPTADLAAPIGCGHDCLPGR